MTNIPRLNRDNILFVFMDLQEKLLMKIPEVQRLLSRNELLIAAANVLGLPYMLTSQYRKGLGEIAGSLRDKIKVPVLDKTSFSCMGDETVAKEVDKSGRRSLVISGVETHICVLQTCLDLLAKGFQVSVVADAVAARTETDHELGLKRMESAGAMLVTAEMVIYELLGRSDTDAFKKILPLIKQE
jgi:nicotinamidase-related amidase